MKRFAIFFLILLLCTSQALALEPAGAEALEVPADSAILMEKQTGTILYEKNAYEHLAPASVTKVMTMLLVMEAIADGSVSPDEPVTASARAASMGGS